MTVTSSWLSQPPAADGSSAASAVWCGSRTQLLRRFLQGAAPAPKTSAHQPAADIQSQSCFHPRAKHILTFSLPLSLCRQHTCLLQGQRHQRTQDSARDLHQAGPERLPTAPHPRRHRLGGTLGADAVRRHLRRGRAGARVFLCEEPQGEHSQQLRWMTAAVHVAVQQLVSCVC
jgi:hypothetical protein